MRKRARAPEGSASRGDALALLFAAIAWGGCTCLGFDAHDRFACSDAGTCGVGQVCSQGLCLNEEELPMDGGPFVFEHPASSGRTLRAVSAASPDEAWAVGDEGTILHWDGGRWASLPRAPHGVGLNAVWTRADGLTLAVGEGGAIFRLDRPELEPQNAQTNSTLLGISGNEELVLVVGEDGVLLRSSGSGEWGRVKRESDAGVLPDGGALAAFRAVWLRSTNAGYAVGDGQTELRWDGQSWSDLPKVYLPTGKRPNLRAVHGGGAAQLAMAGEEGTYFNYLSVPNVWMAIGLPFSSGRPDLNAVHATEDGRGIWLASETGELYQGVDAGTPMLRHVAFPRRALHGLGGTAEEGLWAVGERGAILRNTGGAWATIDDGLTVPLQAVVEVSPGALWAAGDQRLLRREDDRWEVAATVDSALRGAWSDGAGRAWFVGDDGLVLALEDGGIGGRLWPGHTPLHAVWGTADGRLYVVGEAGLVLLRSNGDWSTLVTSPSNGATLRAVTGVGDDLWIVGDDGGAYRRQGNGALLQVPTGVSASLRGVWGAAPDDVWAVGSDGVLLHFDGQGWTDTGARDGGPSLRAVHGRSARDVWATGAQGVLFHHDGQGWAPWPSNTDAGLNSVWSTDGGTWLVGDDGVILRGP